MPFRNDHHPQLLLLPPNLETMVPEKDLARVIDRFVESLPYRALEQSLEQARGRPSFPPRMMLKVLLYAYSQGVYSSRGIAKALRQNVCFLWLAGMACPNFTTVNRFRSVYLADCLEGIFSRLAEFLLRQGYVRGEDYFVDGTLLEADAGKYTVVWRKNTQRFSAAVRRRAREILDEVERVNRDEDQRYGTRDLEETGDGVELTAEAIEEAARRIGRELEATPREKARLRETVRRRRQVRQLQKEAAQLRLYEAQQERLGGRNSYSKTDPAASFMRLKNGELRAGYNLQVGVENGFILGYSLSPSPNDAAALGAHLEAHRRQNGGDDPRRVIADAGYGTEENYARLAADGIEAYVKYPGWSREVKGRAKRFEKAAFRYDAARDEFECPQGRRLVRQGEHEVVRHSGYKSREIQYASADCGGCSHQSDCTRSEVKRTLRHNPQLVRYQQQASQRLLSDRGVALRKRRSWESETPFAMLKKNLRYGRLRLRGWAKATLEIGYLMIAMNLIRLASPKAQPI